jgi:hypothetical protein
MDEFSWHDVVVSGYSVPFLQAGTYDKKVALLLDNRFAVTITARKAESVVPFVAHAIAVALGHQAHPTSDTPLPLHPMPRRIEPQRVVCFKE